MNHKYIIIAAALLSVVPLTDLAAQQKPAAQEKPAYVKLDLNADFKKIQEENKKGNNPDYAAIDKALSAYYEANKGKVSPQQCQQILEKLVENAARIDDPAVADKYVAMLDQSGRNMGQYTMFFVSGRFASAYTWGNEYKFCERLYEKYKDRIDVNYRTGIIVNHAMPFRNPGRFDASVKLIDELLSLKAVNPKNDPNVDQKFEEKKTGELLKIINMLLAYDYNKAAPVLAKYRTRFSDGQIVETYIAIAQNAKNNNDRPLYDKMLANVKALPDSDQKVGWLLRIGDAARGTMIQTKIQDELLARTDLTPQRRVEILNRRYSLPGTRTYGIHGAEAYPKWKAAKLEQIRIIDANPQIWKNPSGEFQRMYASAWEYGDYKFANELMARIMKFNGKDPLCMWQERVREMVRLGKDKEASALLRLALEAKNVHQNQKNDWKIFKYFLDGGTFDGFDAAFADRKFNSEQKMIAIRSKACAVFMDCGRHEMARKISDELIAKMFRPSFGDRRYTVKYMPKAPSTAEAWARSADYQDWSKMETRFFPYFGYNTGNDKMHLKDNPLPALKEEYKSGLHMVYDELGVHIYVRCNDPKAIEVDQGKRNGATLEWMFSPGDQNAYYWFLFEGIPDNSDRHYVNWASPTKHYRLTYDVIFKDSCTTKEGYAAHVFIPWIGVYDKMPSKDNVWRIGVQISNGDFRTLSGCVHEIHRGVIMDFEFTPAQRIAIEREICIKAFNRYNRIRQDAGGKIQNWNDIQLGDRAFYKASVADYIRELDEAGKKLLAPAKDEEIHAIFTKYVPQWAEINYMLEEKRQDFLLDELFRE